MNKEISLSMMCADPLRLEEALNAFKSAHADYLHVDIMDGRFVPNITLGTDYCRILKKSSDIPLDIHLMIEEPENRLDWFNFGPGDLVSVHVESTKHLQRVLHAIRSRGAKPIAALNPATPLQPLNYVLDDIDGVLVMCVNPGYSGQELIPATVQKIKDTRNLLDASGHPDIRIEVDGNVSLKNAQLMSKAGADIFVAGTSSVFQPEKFTLSEGISLLRKAIAS
ncbi:MAG TPA: ribulose-phosphate 3-epimerase [Oscillospiraceae bacterium]|nr:ribulose-phosphate 3-epimerase [Oscillospiraceae bacterium]HPF56341.1 ribulose-phosphate 3-epimerase [Clostridiales bacterium]HPK35674.1 ribulose-phosphate 3-epimerase [Oscillospiraceae bacterium]HPR75788.1 ribulose-phosphate 3-epimerase [Oscillospiraceae bacterium]